MSVREFSIGVQRFAKLGKDRAVIGQRKVTLELATECVVGNEVDTGRSRNGWVASAGAPSSYVPPVGAGDLSGQHLEEAAGLRIQFGEDTFVANNVDYVGHINDTHPRSAGWVDRAVAKVEQRVAVMRPGAATADYGLGNP